ncbi:MAG: muramoyltetrapeptide carboxypeptidase [Flavobacteriales bacterium]|jgi:muramoyltetrapeptide carboxypeptidase
MKKVIPPFLKKGDKIGIVGTARSVEKGQLDNVTRLLEKDGFEVVLSPNIYEKWDRYAGKDGVRTESFQAMLNDDSLSAILCARGGYGTARMIDGIDWTAFLQKPKWICGFSDVTVIHSHVNKLGVATIHSIMGTGFRNSLDDDPNYLTLVSELIGKPFDLKVDASPLNRTGEVRGEFIGGNLAVLSSIIGSPSDTEWTDKILFLEDINEYPYNIDRIMLNLKRNGRLSGLKGLVVGDISEKEEDDIPFGKTVYEVVAEHVSDYDYPVAFRFPIGHEKVNLAIRFGDQVQLSVHSDFARIYY